VDLTRYALGKIGDYPMHEEPQYRYAIEIFWSKEDGCFVACVPDLENCAAWGITYEQALTQAHLAIQADLISRRVFGDPISDPAPRFLPEQSIN
jgi:predicted RNase H-like HicB family nuclease